MRDHSRVSSTYWTGRTGHDIRKRGRDAQLVGAYLMFAPGSNMLGVFHLPIATLASAICAKPEDLGRALEDALKALRSLSEVGFCTYDEELEWVWVREMAAWQVDDELKRDDNRTKAVAKLWLSLPKLPFLNEFYARYRVPFHLPQRPELASPFEAPSKPGAGAGTEEDKEEQGPSTSDGLPRAEPETGKNAVPYQAIVDLYNRTMVNLPKVRELTGKRRTLIRNAWHASAERRRLEFWEAYFEECALDDFLNGKGPYRNGHENWRPDFDYLLRATTVTRTFERAMDRIERRAH